MKIIALCYASPVLSRHAKRKAMRMFQKILSMMARCTCVSEECRYVLKNVKARIGSTA